MSNRQRKANCGRKYACRKAQREIRNEKKKKKDKGTEKGITDEGGLKDNSEGRPKYQQRAGEANK